MKKLFVIVFCLTAVQGAFQACASSHTLSTDGGQSAMLIDDFSSTTGLSALGTKWIDITDQVMGGISEMTTVRDDYEGEPALRMRGDVSLENNGGFIQSRLMLQPGRKLVNASAFKGIRIRVRGNGENYALHLRTSRTILPWQYYSASFPTTGQWKTIDVPFSAFKPASLGTPLNPAKLRSVALVAIKKQMQADVALSRIEFYE